MGDLTLHRKNRARGTADPRNRVVRKQIPDKMLLVQSGSETGEITLRAQSPAL